MTRVIHTGDTHVGYQQYNVPDRRDDFLDAFRQVVRDAIADDADAVVHAGDLFHDRRPALTDIMGTLTVLEELSEAGIPFLAVVGNHEAKRDAQWLDLYESLGLATRLDDEPTVIGDTAFYGLDFVPRSQRDDLDYDFGPHDADSAALVTHGLFQPFDYGDWDAEEILTESSVEFDAMLLGDNHDPGKQQVEDAWVTYCGSTERASASERADRGYNIVTFDDEVQITRRGLDTREFVFVDVDLGPKEGVERVRSRVGQHDLEDAVVIVSISGDGDPVTPASVESFALDRGALVARVTDHREITAEERETDISFADPDDAVTERVRDLGLSEAAHDIDETIRASKVADANVKDEVERHVRELLSEDSDALEADTDAAASGGTADAEANTDTAEDDTDDGAAVNEADDKAPVDGADDDGQASVEEFL
ncbi:phosphoesterase [Haloarcula marismortui ATCC 43049]|jgi:DNA repair exonuclease SbcCD nuclease subunit|uniref:DNA double-strand break repair protein Mre11 n=1 Tax=Haloarcula marismortui (strain ATCC 43049 / DSM 3752 / JCM 8966 / VKM B-1809) TaxID=272569 RepID=Q5V176_HALMA|nr:DNA double-strand break repair protein Mre11 [Haloarcula marismortui]AAV46727.1 phosphoesterase [Haloarcula marismortui ATCC 43049]QCP91441.1 exonuclease SbcCD subunit D [Haloarcula marismortui ATCC 43049]